MLNKLEDTKLVTIDLFEKNHSVPEIARLTLQSPEQVTAELINWQGTHRAKIKELEAARKQVKEALSLFNRFEPDLQSLLKDYLVPYEDRFILKKRFDSGFRRSLEKRGIIVLTDNFLYEVNSVSLLVEQLAYRLKRGFHIHWDYEREDKRNPLGFVSKEAEYSNARVHGQDIEQIEKKLAEYKKIHRQITKRLKELPKETDVAALSEGDESKQSRYKAIQQDVINWLIEDGYVAAGDVELPSQQKADVIAYKEWHVVIILIRLTVEEYERDRSWEMLLPYTDELYFYVDFELVRRREHSYLYTKEGHYVKVFGEAVHERTMSRDNVEWIINRHMAKKLLCYDVESEKKGAAKGKTD